MHQYMFAGLSVFLLVLCCLVAWSRKEKHIRWTVIAIGLLTLAGSYPTFVNLLSRPKDVGEEWYYKHAKEAQVIGVFIREGTALYLTLKLPKLDEPRLYAFPWSEETRALAKSLQETMESNPGEGIMIPYPFEPSLEREKPLLAHPLPQFAPTPKPPPEGGPIIEYGI